MSRRPAAPLACLATLLCISLLGISIKSGHGQEPAKKPVSIFDLRAKTIDGEEVGLANYKGEVLLIVNTASQCGYTSQYQSLEALHGKYKGKGLRVLAFPSNDFGNQEPGSEAEIKAFCQSQYHVTFTLFAKTVVKGESLHPVYAFLTSKEANPKFPGEVTWNFAKFLVNRKGEIIARFEPADAPESDAIVHDIEAALAESK